MNLPILRYGVRIRAWAIASYSTASRIITTPAGAITTAARKAIRPCTRKSGRLLTGQSPRATTFTTSIVTPTTMHSITSCVSRKLSTSRYIFLIVKRTISTASTVGANTRPSINARLAASVRSHASQLSAVPRGWTTFAVSACGADQPLSSIGTNLLPTVPRLAPSGTGLSTASLRYGIAAIVGNLRGARPMVAEQRRQERSSIR